MGCLCGLTVGSFAEAIFGTHRWCKIARLDQESTKVGEDEGPLCDHHDRTIFRSATTKGRQLPFVSPRLWYGGVRNWAPSKRLHAKVERNERHTDQ